MFRAGLYARVSTNDQQAIPLQIRALTMETSNITAVWPIVRPQQRKHVKSPIPCSWDLLSGAIFALQAGRRQRAPAFTIPTSIINGR
jgi:hypothetical protein